MGQNKYKGNGYIRNVFMKTLDLSAGAGIDIEG
jgi:hypothetical protein